MITIYSNIYSKEAFHISVDKALKRIANGESKVLVEQIRQAADKETANIFKTKLPSVCFSGQFNERVDSKILKHSGFICLDFDNIEDVQAKKVELRQHEFIYAIWISPSGKGIKALVKIADPEKHREHFKALQDILPDIDRSGINVSRVCYESYDPEIIINTNASVFDKIAKAETEKVVFQLTETGEIFEKIVKWLDSKNEHFQNGNRNLYIFKIASACCRFGLMEHETYQNCSNKFLVNDSTFGSSELARTIKSAYKSSSKEFGTAHFDREELKSKITHEVVSVTDDDFISNMEHEREWIQLARNNQIPKGYDIGSTEFDNHFRLKPRTLVGLFGIDNVGKTTFHNFLAVCYSKRHKINWLFVCRENENASIRQNLIELYNGKPLHEQSEEEFNEAVEFSYKYFDILDNKFDLDNENFFTILEKAYAKKHYFATFIDPYNAIQFEQTPNKNYEFLKKLRDFQNTHDTSFHVSMHISTEKARNFVYGDKDSMQNFIGDVIPLGGHLKVPRKNFVEGGQPIANKLDDIIIVHRIAKSEELKHYTLVAIDKVKEYKTGGQPTTDMPIKFRKQFNFNTFVDKDLYNPLAPNSKSEINNIRNFDFSTDDEIGVQQDNEPPPF